MLRLVNEGRANALTERTLDGLVRVLDGPQAKSARVALLTGDGDRHFSSGAEFGQEPPAEHGLAAAAAESVVLPWGHGRPKQPPLGR